MQARTAPESFCFVPPTTAPAQAPHRTLRGRWPRSVNTVGRSLMARKAVQDKSGVGAECEDLEGKQRVQELEQVSYPYGCWSCVIWGGLYVHCGGPSSTRPLLTKIPTAPLSCDNPRLSPDSARHPGGVQTGPGQEPPSQPQVWEAGPLSVAPGTSVLMCLPSDTSCVPLAQCGCLYRPSTPRLPESL